MCITPENSFREVWHNDCAVGGRNGIMRRLNQYISADDGCWLRLFECLHCGLRAFVGVNRQRSIIVMNDTQLAPVQRQL
jgi:hypothetical protein